MEDINYRRRIIDVFVNSVYVYDDKLVFTYNFRDGNETVSLLDIERAIGSESSDLTDSASPKAVNPNFFQIGEGVGFIVYLPKNFMQK